MVVFKNQNNLMVASVCSYKGGKTKLKSYQISKKTSITKKYNQSAWNYWKSKMGREKLIVDEKEG